METSLGFTLILCLASSSLNGEIIGIKAKEIF